MTNPAHTPWVDAHVHLFPAPAADSPAMSAHNGKVNTPENYLAVLGDTAPKGIVVVHFSKSPDSSHVIGALDALKGKGIPAAGVVKADEKHVFDWVLRDDVKGVRIYAKESMPDFTNTHGWHRLWNLVRSKGKHILIFGGAPYLRKAIALLPQDIPLVIDHLGVPTDSSWHLLLADMKARNASAAPVYFKGPGYRTSLDVKEVQPYVDAIVGALGVDRLILGASDAPFAGMTGDLHSIQHFTRTLAIGAAKANGLDEQSTLQALLHDNAARLYGF